MPELHLSRDELIVWRDEGAGDRDRIVTHLAACGACRQVAASLERLRPPDALPARFVPRDFVARGYSVRPGAAVRSPWWRFMPIAAAAAVILAVVFVPAWLRRNQDSASVLRGGDARVTLIRPVDITTPVEELTFEWKAESGLDRARLSAFDLDNAAEPLIRRDVAAATRYEPTAEERNRLPRGRELYWFVEYGGGGSTSATSPAARFRVQ